MKKNEIKQTIEQVVRVEYVAEDGTVFYSEEECKAYEESALFAVSSKLKRLTTEWTSIYQLNEESSEECELEIFDVQTESDLENLRRYLYLKAIKNGASEKCINVFDSVTIGHEVLVFWTYDNDWFWVYKDGSLNGYFEWLKEKYTKIITPKEDKKV